MLESTPYNNPEIRETHTYDLYGNSNPDLIVYTSDNEGDGVIDSATGYRITENQNELLLFSYESNTGMTFSDNVDFNTVLVEGKLLGKDESALDKWIDTRFFELKEHYPEYMSSIENLQAKVVEFMDGGQTTSKEIETWGFDYEGDGDNEILITQNTKNGNTSGTISTSSFTDSDGIGLTLVTFADGKFEVTEIPKKESEDQLDIEESPFDPEGRQNRTMVDFDRP